MIMTGTSLVERKGNTAYPLKHKIRVGKYFTRQIRKAQFCGQDQTCCCKSHVKNKNLRLFEKMTVMCCSQQFITQPRPHDD